MNGIKEVMQTIRHIADDGAVLPLAILTADADKVPVVVLHSLFFDGGMFAACLPLLGQNRTVIAPTFRGQGDADLGSKPPTVAQLAEDLAGALSQLGVSKVHLVGSSMGGYVAMEFLRDHADRTASLTLSCCTSEKEKSPERFAALSRFIASGPHADTGSRVAGIMFGATSLAAPTTDVAAWVDRFGQTPPGMSVAIDAMFAHPAYDDVLTRYDGPALLFAGREDNAKSPADMKRIASFLKAPRLIELDGVGHTPPVEAPTAFGSAVADFLVAHDMPTATSLGAQTNVH